MIISKWSKLNIVNGKGLLLSALLCKAGSSIVIICHGFTGSKEGGGRALEMGEELSKLGFSALLFDFTGCGESEGSFEDISLSAQTSDLGSVVQWCRQTGFRDIVLTGRSFGGTTILNYAAQDKNIKAVCTWAAVARPDKLFEIFVNKSQKPPADHLIALGDEEDTVFLKREFFDDLRKHDLLKCAAVLTPRNFLIIHGSIDESVPLEEAYLLYDAANQPKELKIIEGADHRFTNRIEEVWAAFFDWLKKTA